MTEAQVLVMFTIWEQTKGDNMRTISPDEIAKKIGFSPGHVRKIIRKIMKYEHDRLHVVEKHGKKGRPSKTYRVHEKAVDLEETALILCQLVKYAKERTGRMDVPREQFSHYISKEFGIEHLDVERSIKAALRYRYLTSYLSGYLRGTQRLLDEFEYLRRLADAYEPPKSSTGSPDIEKRSKD